MSDSYNNLIRRIDTSNDDHYVTTIAGAPGQEGDTDGSSIVSAKFRRPGHIATRFTKNGNAIVYVCEMWNHRIREIIQENKTGEGEWNVHTLAGSSRPGIVRDGLGTVARFSYPVGIALSPVDGSLLVTEAQYFPR